MNPSLASILPNFMIHLVDGSSEIVFFNSKINFLRFVCSINKVLGSSTQVVLKLNGFSRNIAYRGLLSLIVFS